MKKVLQLLVANVFVISFCLGQLPPPVQDQATRLMPKPIPASPDVASLGKFGDYAVDLFSGAPEISIPIFEAKSGNLSIPVTLSYHASGIKMTDAAGWVGLGWSLSAGGQISRSVHGKADEDFYAAFNNPALVTNASTCSNYYYLQGIALGSNDTEPDLFSYSFPGKNGKFFVMREQSPQALVPYLVPYEPIVVAPATGFDNFGITDENGVYYKFGKNSQNVYAQEGTYTSAGSTQVSATTAWHLMEMIAPNSNDKITLNYQTVGTINYTDVNNVISICDLCDNSRSDVSCPSVSPQRVDINSGISVGQKGVYEIIFNTGKLEFVLGSFRNDQIASKPLSRINIYSLNPTGGYTLIKYVDFQYSYFKKSLNNSDLHLKLDGVYFKDPGGNTIQKYTFTYFTNSFSWGNNIFARDLWGFYNGQSGNNDLIPPTQVSYQALPSSPVLTTTIGTANRNTSTQYLTEGVLKRIDFPTGGYTEFEFQPHQYFEDNTTYTVGGLRVSKITSVDGIGSLAKVKTYRYGASESGNGVRNFNTFQYNYYNDETIQDKICFSRGFLQPGTLKYRSRTYYSNSGYDPDAFSESPVVYPYVTEYVGDASGTHSGRTVYEYDNGTITGTVFQVVPNSTKYFKDSYSWKNGRLTRKLVYDKNGNKLNESVITYSTFQSQSKFVGYGVTLLTGYYGDLCFSNYCVNEANEHVDPYEFSVATFSHNSGAMRQSSVTEYTYENGNVNKFVMVSNSNTFDSYKLQPTQSTTTKSTGEQTITVSRYPFQLAANSSSTGAAQGIYMLNNKNIISSPIETYSYNINGSAQYMTSAQLTTYRQSESNPSYVVPDQIYLGEFPASYSQASYSPAVVNGSNNGLTMNTNLKPRINMTAYSGEGNIQSVSKVNDAPISYQYGYAKALPIAEVKNALNSNYSYVTAGTGSTAVTMGGASPVSSTYNFTVDYSGTVKIKLSVNGNPSFTTYLDYSGSLGSQTGIVLSNGGCGLTEVVFTGVSTGTKTITLTVRASGQTVGACGSIEYPANLTVSGGITEFAYENFEEGTVTTSPLTAHTGKGYVTSYTPTFQVPNGRSYTMEYWYWNGSAWLYTSKAYTGTNTPVNEGSAYDNVRIYPTDARMKSYTYDPVLGITSVIDENGTVMYYDYDTFGRLARIRNDKGGVEKQYTYHYKGQ